MPANLSAEPLPPASAFPQYPETWYRYCGSRELDRGPVGRSMFGRRLAAFRAEDGRAAVLDAECSHLGADLSRGTVIDDCLRCPYHHWRFGADGRCRALPEGGAPPDFARQRVYPAAERHGNVYLYRGLSAAFPLPFFEQETSGCFEASRVVTYIVDSPWVMIGANAFDRRHLLAVHDRRLLGEPVVDSPHPHALRIRYEAELCGEHPFDRLLRFALGAKTRVSISIWGGLLLVVKTEFPRATSRIMVIPRPLEDGRTECNVITYRLIRHPRAPSALSVPDREIRRWLTRKFLFDENSRLGSMRYHPGSLTDQDRPMRIYFHWLAALAAARTSSLEFNITQFNKETTP